MLIDPNIIPHEAEILVVCFKDTWIRHPARQGKRRAPKFTVDIWSCYDRVEKDLQKNKQFSRGLSSRIYAASFLPSNYMEIFRCFEKGTRFEQN